MADTSEEQCIDGSKGRVGVISVLPSAALLLNQNP